MLQEVPPMFLLLMLYCGNNIKQNALWCMHSSWLTGG